MADCRGREMMLDRTYRVVLTVKQDYEFFVTAKDADGAVEEACCKELDDGVMINDNYECECTTVEVQ
jgi:hypothetical protein